MRDQLSRDEYLNLRHRIGAEMTQGTPRYARARRSTQLIMRLMMDFIPKDRECLNRVEEYLTEVAFFNNMEMVSVPPEKDALDKLELERAMLAPHFEMLKENGIVLEPKSK